MARSFVPSRDPARFHIERAGLGYRVVGPGMVLWEETLGEAAERRDELESWNGGSPSSDTVPLRPAELPDSLVYGPVVSRRLGRSLGLNLTPPGCRVCSFECVYCEFGRESGARGACWPTPSAVRSAISTALHDSGALDAVTISGHGEPTLHPRFPEVVAEVVAEIRRSLRGLPLCVLTNGSTVTRQSVRRALDGVDRCIVTFDAAPERVDRPHAGISLADRIEAMRALRAVTLQSCFIEGVVSNCDLESIEAWADAVRRIQPASVQIYTIDRQPADAGVRPADSGALEEIACLLRDRTGIEAAVFA